jgi:DNA-directed RNA polymerase subunit RPC12/RpoP
MRSELEPYRCRQCGATSYGRLTHRDANGAMTYSGTYRCSGCPLTFSNLAEWRQSASQPTERSFGNGRAVDSSASKAG